MTTAELPPLDLHCESGRAHAAYTPESVEARERILLDRIAELEADAERYRWLRRKVCIIAKPGFMSGDSYAVFEFLDLPFPTYVAPCADIELDAAIDAARGAP